MDIRLAAVLAANPELEDSLQRFENSEYPVDNTIVEQVIKLCIELAPFMKPLDIWEEWAAFYRVHGRITDGPALCSDSSSEPKA